MSFTKNICKNIGDTINKNLIDKYGQKILDHDKISAEDAFKTASRGAIQKTAEKTVDFIGIRIANKITKIFTK